MKLRDAVDLLATHKPHCAIVKPEVEGERWGQPYKHIPVHVVSGGESHIENWMGQLRHTIFGMKFWESTHRGGRDVYLVDSNKLDDERDWFTLITPDPHPVDPFVNIEGKEIAYFAEYRPVYVTDDKSMLEIELTNAMRKLIVEHGQESLLQVLRENKVSGLAFGHEASFKLEMKGSSYEDEYHISSFEKEILEKS